LEFQSVPTQTYTTRPIVHDAVPAGTDFAGGAQALAAKPAAAGEIVPGSDFAGGAIPLTAQDDWAEPDDE
jgi:hypothetical protein